MKEQFRVKERLDIHDYNWLTDNFPISVGNDKSLATTRFIHLAEGVINLANVLIHEDADTLVLLDRSARPVAQLLKSYWRETYPDKLFPDIRFMNIGRESRIKDQTPKFLKKLHDAHVGALKGRKVVIADECVSSGNTLRRAKLVIERVFPEISHITYMVVFDLIPQWYEEVAYLGVYDLTNLIDVVPTAYMDILDGTEPDTHISKSLPGIIRRNGILFSNEGDRNEIHERQTRVNRLRKELTVIGKITATHKGFALLKRKTPTSHLDSNLNSELNKK